ncbi:MAG: dTMP kinase [Holosporales bacterium]|nr:dTMP kinase [Holosporales bacterium]
MRKEEPPPRGRFITFEGGEGTGKSTQIRHAADYVRAQNIPVKLLREPGGTPEGEAIRNLWKNPPAGRSWESLAEAFLLFASRRMLWCREIQPSLEQGVWVLCDRFYDSTLVYQGVLGGADIKKLMEMKMLALEEQEPDLTLLFDMSPRTALKRITKRAPICQDFILRYDNMEMKKHEHIRAGYLRLAEIFAYRFRVVKAQSPEPLVKEAVCALLETQIRECGLFPR